MQDIDLKDREVILVQLVYFTTAARASEFRFFAPSDGWMSDGFRSIGRLVAKIPDGEPLVPIPDRKKWSQATRIGQVSLDAEKLDIVRAVVWTAPSQGFSRCDELLALEPYEDKKQLLEPFWLVDRGTNYVLASAGSLDDIRAEFNDEIERLKM